jgi:hypothetical protein
MECLFTHAQFEDQLAREIFPSAQSGLKLSSTDLGVLLKHLERDRRILTAEKNVTVFPKIPPKKSFASVLAN